MGDLSVRFFSSQMSGAPVITADSVGTVKAAVAACLVTGFGSVTVSSLVVAGGFATATVSAGHGFVDYIAGVLGPVLQISGATPSGLNGNVRATIVSSTAFTFAAPGIADQVATGTITAKNAPAGWTMPFSDSSSAVFVGGSGSSGIYFRMQNQWTTYAMLDSFKTMSSLWAGTRQSLGAYVANAYLLAGSTSWQIVADHKTVYMRIVEKSSGAYYFLTGFGDFSPTNPSDVECGFVGGVNFLMERITDVDNTTLGSTYIADQYLRLFAGFADQTSRSGTVYYPVLTKKALNSAHYFLPGGGDGDLPYPNAITGRADASAIAVLESGSVRGCLRGIWAPQHAKSLWPSPASVQCPDGHTGFGWSIESNQSTVRYGLVFADLSGPWS